MSAVTGTTNAIRYTAFSLMAVVGLVGALFVAGDAFEDPGGSAALLMSAAWLVPTIGLSVFALLRADRAAPILVGATVAVVGFSLADAFFEIIPRDEWGPVSAVAVLALGVTLAFLGLHRSALAGVLMIVAALAQWGAAALSFVVREAGVGGPGPGALLGGSSGAVVLPLLLVGVLFVIAASFDHESLRPRGRRRMHATP